MAVAPYVRLDGKPAGPIIYDLTAGTTDQVWKVQPPNYATNHEFKTVLGSNDQTPWPSFNNIVLMGWGVTAGGGAIDPARGAMWLSWERNFQQDLTWNAFEWHLAWMPPTGAAGVPDGSQLRPISVIMRKEDPGFGWMNIDCSNVNWFDAYHDQGWLVFTAAARSAPGVTSDVGVIAGTARLQLSGLTGNQLSLHPGLTDPVTFNGSADKRFGFGTANPAQRFDLNLDPGGNPSALVLTVTGGVSGAGLDGAGIPDQAFGVEAGGITGRWGVGLNADLARPAYTVSAISTSATHTGTNGTPMLFNVARNNAGALEGFADLTTRLFEWEHGLTGAGTKLMDLAGSGRLRVRGNIVPLTGSPTVGEAEARWPTLYGVEANLSSRVFVDGPQSGGANNTQTGTQLRVSNSFGVRVRDGTTGISGAGSEYATQLINGAGSGPLEIYCVEAVPLVLGVGTAEGARLSSAGLVTVKGVGMYGVTPPGTQPVGGAATAGGTYGAPEQGMLQKLYDAARATGLLS